MMLKKFAGLTAGAVVYSIGIALFLDPFHLAPGGVGGIAILLSHVIPVVDTGIWILLLNIPLLLLGMVAFGRGFLLSTVYTTVLSALCVGMVERLTSTLPPITDNILLASLAGGSSLALGMGLVFRSGGTTGGTDIVVKLLRRRLRYLKTGMLFLLTDAVVVLLSIPILGGVEPALYATVALVTASVLFDKVLYGTDGGKLFYIITDYPDEIAGRILSELDLGVTYLRGEGAYTGAPKRVLLCVARKQLSYRIRDLVSDLDPAAFLIVTPASEVLGEGFKPHGADEL